MDVTTQYTILPSFFPQHSHCCCLLSVLQCVSSVKGSLPPSCNLLSDVFTCVVSYCLSVASFLLSGLPVSVGTGLALLQLSIPLDLLFQRPTLVKCGPSHIYRQRDIGVCCRSYNAKHLGIFKNDSLRSKSTASLMSLCVIQTIVSVKYYASFITLSQLLDYHIGCISADILISLMTVVPIGLWFISSILKMFPGVWVLGVICIF